MSVKRWSPEEVVRFIESCRASGGIPVFKAAIKGEKFQVHGENAVLAVCYGGEEEEGSILFYGVPETDMELIIMRKGEWKDLLDKYKRKREK